MQKGNLGTRGFYKLHRMSPNEILQNKSSKSKKEVFYKMERLQNVCKHLLKNYLDKKNWANWEMSRQILIPED